MKKIMILAASVLVLAATSCLKNPNTASQNADAEASETETTEAPANMPEGANEAAAAIPANVPQAFIEIIENDPAVTVLPSGLAYKVVKDGQGDKPSETANVTVNYVGRHIDGSVFDQSQQPIDFNLQGVIAGFREGITQMNRGAQYILYIPSNLAYGENGAGNIIAPNEPLIFEIELIDF